MAGTRYPFSRSTPRLTLGVPLRERESRHDWRVTGRYLKKMTVGCPVFGRLPRDLSISGRSFAKMLRMADTAASEAARRLVAQRWRGQRPVRLARELAERVGELPTEERSRLLDAL